MNRLIKGWANGLIFGEVGGLYKVQYMCYSYSKALVRFTIVD